jgi:glycosyltransferase involved in cell wall biosynthesis
LDSIPAVQIYRYLTYTMILPVYNEESRIGRVIEYYKPFARLIVIDNFSTDKTWKIVQELGVELVQYKNPGTIQTPEFFQFVATLFETDYYILLSCSEFIPLQLLDLFNKIAQEHKYDVVSCVRVSYTCGELIPLWGGRLKGTDARVERFYNKHALNLDKVVIHGHFIPMSNDRLLKLPRDKRYIVTHLRDSDAKSLIKKSLDYSFVEANHRFRNNTPLKIWKLMILFLKEILRFLQLPLSKWNMIALREIWARMIMHSIIYWIGWELRSGKDIAYSHKQNENLWQELVTNQSHKLQNDQ